MADSTDETPIGLNMEMASEYKKLTANDAPPKPEDTEHVSFWERIKAGNIDAKSDDPNSAYQRWGAGKKERMAREIESEKARESRRNESKPAETPEPSKPVNPTVAPREEFAAEAAKMAREDKREEAVQSVSPAKPDQTPIKEQASTKKATQPVPKTITRQPEVKATLPSPASQAEAPMADKVTASPPAKRPGIMSRMRAKDAALNEKIIAGAKKMPQEESILDSVDNFMKRAAARK